MFADALKLTGYVFHRRTIPTSILRSFPWEKNVVTTVLLRALIYSFILMGKMETTSISRGVGGYFDGYAKGGSCKVETLGRARGICAVSE